MIPNKRHDTIAEACHLWLSAIYDVERETHAALLDQYETAIAQIMPMLDPARGMQDLLGLYYGCVLEQPIADLLASMGQAAEHLNIGVIEDACFGLRLRALVGAALA